MAAADETYPVCSVPDCPGFGTAHPPVATDLDLDEADPALLLGELDTIAGRLEGVEDEARRLYDRRADLFVALRRRQPPVMARDIASAARTTEGAVTQVVLKRRRQGLPTLP